MKLGRGETGIVLLLTNGRETMTVTIRRPKKTELMTREEKLQSLQKKTK